MSKSLRNLNWKKDIFFNNNPQAVETGRFDTQSMAGDSLGDLDTMREQIGILERINEKSHAKSVSYLERTPRGSSVSQQSLQSGNGYPYYSHCIIYLLII